MSLQMVHDDFRALTRHTCPADGLWWLSSKKSRRDGIRAVLVVPALASLLAGLEGRIIFHAFGEYLRLQPPWSYVAVTVALYGVGLLFFLHYAGEHLWS